MAPWLLSYGFAYNAALKSDSNGDGVSLLTAYALNLDPNKDLSGSMPKPVILGDQMSLGFHAGNGDLTYRVESSKDLKNWSTGGVSISVPDARGTRTATVGTTDTKRFMRLVVER